jgi:hypothetical protein
LRPVLPPDVYRDEIALAVEDFVARMRRHADNSAPYEDPYDMGGPTPACGSHHALALAHTVRREHRRLREGGAPANRGWDRGRAVTFVAGALVGLLIAVV